MPWVMWGIREGRVLAPAVVLALSLAATGAPAAPQLPAPNGEQTYSGKQLYLAYCAACHGADARGSGPAAPSLKVPPTDLTRLAAGNKGEFPRAFVRESIVQGRRAHGSPDMPTWGPVFVAMDDNVQAALRLAALVNYIEEIQRK